MVINTYLSTIESKNKINKQAEHKQTHTYRKYFHGCQMGGGLGRWMKKELRSTDSIRSTELSWGCKGQHREYSQ